MREASREVQELAGEEKRLLFPRSLLLRSTSSSSSLGTPRGEERWSDLGRRGEATISGPSLSRVALPLPVSAMLAMERD
uniref:Uncharacterized protein n=1 Tax=Oryza punctata TaxID=4537 RepID=A0A0E0KXS6_ORYPU